MIFIISHLICFFLYFSYYSVLIFYLFQVLAMSFLASFACNFYTGISHVKYWKNMLNTYLSKTNISDSIGADSERGYRKTKRGPFQPAPPLIQV